MSIQEIFSNFKRFLGKGDVPLMLLIMTVAAGSFFLGRATLSLQSTPRPVTFTETSNEGSVIQTRERVNGNEESPPPEAAPAPLMDTKPLQEGSYVASKSGDKYHLPWCSGAKRIKEENKIWFKTKEEAEAAGYEPAANCKGI